MGLRAKTLIAVGLVLGGLFIALLSTARTILLDSFSRLEREHVRQDVERVRIALANELDRLDRLALDWASWDDTYAFIEDENPVYIRSNLVDSTLVTLRLNLMVFIHSSGRIVFSKALDLEEEKETPFPQGLLAHLSRHRPLLEHGDLLTGTTGIIVLPEGPLLVSSRPILTSENEGPARGTLIMGRFLDEAEIERLSGLAHLPIAVGPPDDSEVLELVGFTSLGEMPVVVRPLSTEIVAGYTVLKDVYGEPALGLRVDLARDIYQQGQVAVRYSLLSFVGIGLVFGLAMLAVLEWQILLPVAGLSRAVRQIGASDNLSARVQVAGRDELSGLAKAINWMLEELEFSKQQLVHAATHDPLTGLPNRMLFNDRLTQAVARARRNQEKLAVMSLDLDYFKDVNDTLGHIVGDQLLKAVGQRLRSILRESDAIARVGGDEFMLVLPGVAQRRDAATAAQKVLEAIRQAVAIGDQELHTRVSIGIAMYPEDGQDADALVARADTAMYEAKRQGRDNYQLYEPGMNATALGVRPGSPKGAGAAEGTEAKEGDGR